MCFICRVSNQQQAYYQGGYSATIMHDTYVDLGRQFYSLYPVSQWVNNCAAANEIVRIFKLKVNPSGRKLLNLTLKSNPLLF